MRCDPKNIDLLLNGDESSAAFQVAADHVENCARCRKLLLESSDADGNWWREAQEVLNAGEEPDAIYASGRSSVTIEVETSLGEDVPIEFESVSLHFLSPASQPELLGRLGRYDIERVVGTGGMGIVLKAYDTELHRIVAIKVLAPHLAHSAAARRRFAREAQAAAAVMHPNVIPIHNVETDGQVPFLVMRYVAGQSLQARVDREGPMPITEVLRIAQQAAAGLTAAHAQGLVHRDIKPANLLLEDNVDRVLLSDFGLARTVDDASLTRTGIVAGTPFYMSPEQARGEAIDCRSDLFSLGSVIYFMLTGRPPFRAQGAMAVLHRICQDPHRKVSDINPDVPRELEALVDRLLAKKPSERFATTQEVEVELGRLLADWQRGKLTVRRAVQSKDEAFGSRGLLLKQSLLLNGIVLTVIAGWLARDYWQSTTRDSNSPRSIVSVQPDQGPAIGHGKGNAKDLGELSELIAEYRMMLDQIDGDEDRKIVWEYLTKNEPPTASETLDRVNWNDALKRKFEEFKFDFSIAVEDWASDRQWLEQKEVLGRQAWEQSIAELEWQLNKLELQYEAEELKIEDFKIKLQRSSGVTKPSEADTSN